MTLSHSDIRVARAHSDASEGRPQRGRLIAHGGVGGQEPRRARAQEDRFRCFPKENDAKLCFRLYGTPPYCVSMYSQSCKASASRQDMAVTTAKKSMRHQGYLFE